MEILEAQAFIAIPNERHLLHRFLPGAAFGENEPRTHGFASFTRLSVAKADRVREGFGAFGIAMSEQWANEHGIQPVVYVHPEGPVFQILKQLFQAGWADYASRRSDLADGDTASLHRGMAGVMIGSRTWASLLQLYEYLQPAFGGEEYYQQQEWRIVNPQPATFNSSTREGMLKEAIQQLSIWRIHQIDFSPEEVEYFVCPRTRRRHLRDKLPADYRQVPIRSLER